MAEKSERLLDLIAALLETRVAMTAGEIHQEILGYPKDKTAFRHAFERDKVDLREMGIPLITEIPPQGDPNEPGYRIPPDEYYLRDPGLRPDELAALRLAVDTIRLDGVDTETGIQKLGGQPASGAEPVVDAIVPFHQHAPVVLDAIGKHKHLTFEYPSGDGIARRNVDPLHLHTSRGRWHLHAHDHARGQKRQFRLDRIIGDVVVGAEGSAVVTKLEAPVELTLHGWTLGDSEPVAGRVRIGPGQAPVATREVEGAATVENEADGSVVLTLQVRNVSGFRSFVLGYLDDAEVIDPPWLRQDMVDWLTTIAKA